MAALAVVAAWVWPHAAAARGISNEGPLPWHANGRVSFTVDAASRPDSAGTLLEVYVRVPPSTIRRLEADAGGQTELHIAAELRSAYGARRQPVEQQVLLAPADTTGGYGKVVLLRFHTRPGTQRLKVRLEDARSHKVGILYLGRPAREGGEVSGEFDIPPPQQGRELSDPTFVWSSQDSTAGEVFRRGDRLVIPNPARLYGLLDDRFEVAFTARGATDSLAWRWRVRLLDARDSVVAQRDSVGPVSRGLEAGTRFDVSHVPAGGYDVEVTASQEGDAHPLVRRARFGVAWEPETWFRDASSAQDLVHFLLTAADEERFLTLNPGEQERWLSDFWMRRDPSPDTPRNEFREQFMDRVEAANRRYTRASIGSGMYSDMGRVYIRYGDPGEVMKEVMPAGSATLQQMIQELSISEGRSFGDLASGGIGGDMRPFELWVYDGDIGLPPDADPRTDHGVRRKRLVFLFVDEHGLGDYRLRYSNE